jgi:hypothetical protein
MAARGSKRSPLPSPALRGVQDVGKSTVAFIPQTFLNAYISWTISMWDGAGAMKMKCYFKSWRYQEPWKGEKVWCTSFGNPSMHLHTFALGSINLYIVAPLNTGLSIITFKALSKQPTKTKLRGFSPQANYTDRATAPCWRSYCGLLRIEGVAWSAQRIPTAVNLNFLDPEPLPFHSSSSSVTLTRLSGPSSSPTTFPKSG